MTDLNKAVCMNVPSLSCYVNPCENCCMCRLDYEDDQQYGLENEEDYGPTIIERCFAALKQKFCKK